MKKMFVFVLFCFFLVSCTSLIGTKQTVSVPVITGSKGVESSFVDNAPPLNVFENQQFEIAFNLQNQGGSDVQNGVYVVGIPDDFVTQDSVYGRYILKGQSLFYPFGDSKYFSLNARARTLGPMLQTSASVISIDVCYQYRTILNSPVCINPVSSIIANPVKICTPSSLSFSGQGAPVAVTTVETPIIMPNDNPALITPQFVLHVKNLGTGLVVSKQNYADACSQKSSKDVFNIVQVSGSLEDIPLDCKPSVLHLSSGDDTIVCTATSGIPKGEGSHESVLNINLDYGYFSEKMRPISIKRALQ